jgi:hypothetical protein
VAAETGFNIDGTVYEVPMIDSLTTDEAQVLYDYSRLTLDDFVPPKDETAEEKHDREEILRNPGFLRALMHIAYQRAHPEIRAAKVRALVGAANFVSALETMGNPEPDEEGGDDDVPPASTSEQPEPSPTSSLENTPSPPPTIATPGNGSANGSDAREDQPATTTASRSDTSSTFAHPI